MVISKRSQAPGSGDYDDPSVVIIPEESQIFQEDGKDDEV